MGLQVSLPVPSPLFTLCRQDCMLIANGLRYNNTLFGFHVAGNEAREHGEWIQETWSRLRSFERFVYFQSFSSMDAVGHKVSLA